jgi:flagellar biosynthesis protein FlhF
MKIKRFVAKDMRSALAEVKEFLGPDAIILSNKKVSGGVEIVAAVDADTSMHNALEPAKTVDKSNGNRDANVSVGRVNIRIDDESEPDNLRHSPRRAEPVNTSSAPFVKQSMASHRSVNEPSDDADSLRALLARQMLKQQKAELNQTAQVGTATLNAKKLADPAALLQRKSPATTERQQNGGSSSSSMLSGGQFQQFTELQQQQAQQMQQQFDAMRQEMQSMRQLLSHQVSGLMWQDLARREPIRALVIEQLKQLGLSSAMADQLACFMPEELSVTEAWPAALELLAGQLTTTQDDIINRGGIVALVGPTGVGKTTTVAKLAARFAKLHGPDQVALITTDTFRIGAFEQLATYGRIIGCPVRQVKDYTDLATLLTQLQNRKLILIDTAGMSQRDVRLAENLSAIIQNSRVKIKSYLVLSATSQARVMQEAVDHFKRISLAGCIFTKLDECLSLGEIINIAIENAMPVSYLTHGQRVPEDIEVANATAMIAQAEFMRTAHQVPAHQWYQEQPNQMDGTYA